MTAANPMPVRTMELGTTGLHVTDICFGTSPLSGMSPQYGDDAPEERAIATVLRAFDGPVNFLDTSNNYGAGNGELRIGRAIARAGGVPSGFVIATKVDPLPGSDDFSGARVRASVQESLGRLGLDRFDLVHLHDPERITFDEGMATDGPVAALVALRDEGVIGHLGVAGGPPDLLRRYLETGAFEVVLNHNRFTLIDRTADELMDDAARRGVAFINAAPYGGGLLAKGAAAQPNYAYSPAPVGTIERVAAMRAACDRHGVPLPAAALQFSLRDPRIASTVVGMSAPERIDETVRFAALPVPPELWDELAES